jgi:hypothetical protein
VVLDSVELPGWLFDGEQPAPEVEAAAAVAAEEDAAPPTEAVEVGAPAAAEQAAELADDVDDEDAEQQQHGGGAVQSEVEGGHHAAVQAEAEQADSDAASGEAGEEGEEDEDCCHVCGQSGEAGDAAAHWRRRFARDAISMLPALRTPPARQPAHRPSIALRPTADEGDVLLLCDSCDNACHLSCCTPPLKRVPKGDWFCSECTARQAAEAAAAAQIKCVQLGRAAWVAGLLQGLLLLPACQADIC